MQKGKKTVQSVFIIIAFTIGSKLLGFIREMLIAAKFGSGVVTDTFFIASTAVSLFKVMITHSINTTMIPVLSRIEYIEGKEGKRKHTNNLLNLITLVSFVIIILGEILSPYIIKVVAYGFEGNQFKLAVYMMRIGMFIILFSGIIGVFRGYLQSEFMFIESAVADFPFNFVYIIFLIFLSGIFGIKGLMAASVLAVGSQILIQLPGLRKTGYKYIFIIDVKDKYVRKIAHLVPPVFLSVAITDINKIIDKSLASTLIDGSVSALNYGNRLTNLVLGVFITAITTVMFPLLSSEANRSNNDDFKNVVRYGINSILIITIPAAVGLIVLAEPIVRLAFERGEFDSYATVMTVGAMTFYSLGLVGMALRLYLDKVYYSLQDTKTPMLNGVITIILNIILNFTLIGFMAHEGLAFATSLSITITSILLIFGLKKKLGNLELIKYVKCAIKSLVASLVMGFVVYLIYHNLYPFVYENMVLELVVLFSSISIGVIVYLGILHLLRVEEIGWFLIMLKSKLSSQK